MSATDEIAEYSPEWLKLFDGGATVAEGGECDAESGLTEKQVGLRRELAARLEEGRVLEGPELQRWGDVRCQLRYLRARGWDVEKALALLRGTVAWRQEYGPQLSSSRMERELLRREVASQKMYIAGQDRSGRPVVVMRPARDNTGDEDAEWKVRYLVWVAERAAELMDSGRGVEKMVWLIEMSGMKVAMTHSMSITKECINVMQSHYVERLGKAFFINAPWLFNALWRVISPFLDPVTKAKVSFIKNDKSGLRELHRTVDPSQLEPDLAGTFNHNFEIEHWVRTGEFQHSDGPSVEMAGNS